MRRPVRWPFLNAMYALSVNQFNRSIGHSLITTQWDTHLPGN